MSLQKTLFNKSQGFSARLLDKMPNTLKNKLAKRLGYQYDFEGLNPFYKCMLAVQHLQKKQSFIGEDFQKSRDTFKTQMRSILKNPTVLKQVKALKLPLAEQQINARHYHPQPKKALPLIVFYHGGGWVVGDLSTHDEACRLLAKHANVQVLSIDYPLAPEYGPNQIVRVCVEAIEWVYKNKKSFNILNDRIAVAGDSAGGNLSAVVAQKTQHTIYAPSAQLLIYPALDFKKRYPSFDKFKQGLILCEEDINAVTKMYPEKHAIALDDPIISPIYGEISKVAPAFILTSGFDLLHDEGELYAKKLQDAGIKVHYTEAKDQTHGFINFTPISQSAYQQWMNTAKQFRSFWDQCH